MATQEVRTCRQCECVDIFLDRELDSASCEDFRRHLGQCPSCDSHVHDVIQLELLAVCSRRMPAGVLEGMARHPGHC